MVNDLGQRIKTAGPSTPVEITGINDATSWDRFVVFSDENKLVVLVNQDTKQALYNNVKKVKMFH